MNELLVEMTTPPLYGQVSVQDVGTSDVPDWETGEERAIASEHAILVATRADTEGDVVVRVFRGDRPLEGEVVFDGELSLTSPRIEVGNTIAANLAQVEVGRAGYVRMRVFVQPGESPELVSVLLDPLS